jgi:hypothetical protein
MRRSACRSGGSLAVTGELVGSLADSCLEPGRRELKRIKGRLGEQVELLSRRERRSILPGHAELGHYTQDALRLFLFLPLLFLVGCRGWLARGWVG